jgi:hypothetical protein
MARKPELRPTAEELAYALGTFTGCETIPPSYTPANAPPSAPTRGG